MRLLSAIILTLCISLSAFSQKLIKAEYFIDVDPGFGNGTGISLANDSLIDTNLVVDISGLASGLHTFHVRAKNDSGFWSVEMTRNFMVVTSAQNQVKDITYLEYFIDTDPGYGYGTPLSVMPDTVQDVNYAIDLSTVNPGSHVLVVRARDSVGTWSHCYSRMFSKSASGILPQITSIEYFIDTDTGYGTGTQLSFTSDSILDLTDNIDLSTVNPGSHMLLMRAKDVNGTWSETHSRMFIRSAAGVAPNIVSTEYFVDTDPGYGQGTQRLYNPADSSINDTVSVDLNGLTEGSHVLMMRSKDENGVWSETHNRMFIHSNTNVIPITKVEYFVDTDPGYGNGGALNITPDTVIQGVLNPDVSSLSNGLHLIYFRAQDSLNHWSHTYHRLFEARTNDALQPVNALRYSFDTASVFGAGANSGLSPDTLIDQNADLNVSGLSIGYHKVYYYAQDIVNQWSLMNLDSICVGPQALFTADTVCLGTATQITNMSYGGDTATVYLWDIDNNGTVDYTGPANITHTFVTAGNHAIKLVVYNDTTCADTLVINTLVNALPVVTLSSTSATACPSYPVTITASGAASYMWNTGAQTSSIVVNPTANTNYSVIGTDVNACSDTAGILIGYSIGTNYKGIAQYDSAGIILPVRGGKVKLYEASGVGSINPIDSSLISTTGSWQFAVHSPGAYKVYIEPNRTLHPVLHNTYHNLQYTWDSASVETFVCGDTVNRVLWLQYVGPTTGNITISGHVRTDSTFVGKVARQGDPLPGVDISLEQHPGSSLRAAMSTNSAGYYQFNNIPVPDPGHYYIIIANIPGYGLDSSYILNITGSGVYEDFDYFVGDSTIYISDSLQNVFNKVKAITPAPAANVKAYPNPYNDRVNIEYTLKENARVMLNIYTLLGEQVQMIENIYKPAGNYKITFSTKEAGLNAGVYIARLLIDDAEYIIRLIEMK